MKKTLKYGLIILTPLIFVALLLKDFLVLFVKKDTIKDTEEKDKKIIKEINDLNNSANDLLKENERLEALNKLIMEGKIEIRRTEVKDE